MIHVSGVEISPGRVVRVSRVWRSVVVSVPRIPSSWIAASTSSWITASTSSHVHFIFVSPRVLRTGSFTDVFELATDTTLVRIGSLAISHWLRVQEILDIVHFLWRSVSSPSAW